jgi:hypothetical protein
MDNFTKIFEDERNKVEKKNPRRSKLFQKLKKKKAIGQKQVHTISDNSKLPFKYQNITQELAQSS